MGKERGGPGGRAGRIAGICGSEDPLGGIFRLSRGRSRPRQAGLPEDRRRRIPVPVPPIPAHPLRHHQHHHPKRHH